MSEITDMANDHSFASSYMEHCKKQRIRPLPMICVTLPHTLDFTTDRVKMDDWKPILNSLSFDRTLRSINVRSKYQCRKWLDQANSESKARSVGKAPVVLTRFLLEWLCHSLSQCIRYSSVLANLELEGVPLPEDCLVALCLGLANTKSLQHLSLQRCHIGDTGCEVICRAIANVQSIRSLNLSQCDLTSRAGSSLASALSRQKLILYHDVWKASLRYREPELETMPGLRRLTLNGNSKLGDEAAASIIEAVGDNLWFKALDLQQCGLSDGIAKVIHDLLDHNKTLVVLDVRLNSGLREATLTEITKRLNRNGLCSENEYRWLNVPQKENAAKRVSSACSIHKQKQPEPRAALVRPRSAIIRQVKRPIPPIIFRKPLAPMPQNMKRLKMKPPLPIFEKRVKQPMKPPQRMQIPKTEPTPKVSLHLDLLTQIQSLTEPDQSNAPVIKSINESDKANEENKVNEVNLDENSENNQFEQVLRELIETRNERDRLEEELRRNNLILAEERASREFAEQKLEAIRCDLSEMKDTLDKRDKDCSGYFLISQKSMDEICQSFGRLMFMLEESSRKSSDSMETLVQEEDNNVERDDIKRKFAQIIRKTKSENLKRGYFVDEHAVLSRPQMTARYGRSEGNIRTTIEPIPPVMRVERRIGDTRETVGLPKLTSNYQGCQSNDVQRIENAGGLPSDRARAIFASIINGNSSISFNSHM